MLDDLRAKTWIDNVATKELGDYMMMIDMLHAVTQLYDHKEQSNCAFAHLKSCFA